MDSETDKDPTSSIKNHLGDIKSAEICNDYNSIETEHLKDIDEIVPINNADLTEVNYTNSGDIVPLKKRQRMMDVPYSSHL